MVSDGVTKYIHIIQIHARWLVDHWVILKLYFNGFPGSEKPNLATQCTCLDILVALKALYANSMQTPCIKYEFKHCEPLKNQILYSFLWQTTFLGFLLEWKKGVLQSCLAIKDANGASPLHYAALQGHTSAIRFLLAKVCLQIVLIYLQQKY